MSFNRTKEEKKMFEIQQQIRNNQITMTEYMKDFSIWEKEMSEKDNLLKKEVKLNNMYDNKSIIVKNTNSDENKTSKNKTIKENLKRDGSSIRSYYDNWSKFDVDEEIKNIEEESTKIDTIIKPYYTNYNIQNNNIKNDISNNKAKETADPNCKINISVNNNRSLLSNDSLYSTYILKQDGISFFKIKNYNKAIEFFTMGIKKIESEFINRKDFYDIDNTQAVNLYSSLINNRGNCHLKQFMYKEALNDFEKVFVFIKNCNVKNSSLNISHDNKLIYRLSYCYYKLNKIDYCIKLIDTVLYNTDKIKDNASLSKEQFDLFDILKKDCVNAVTSETKSMYNRIIIKNNSTYVDNENNEKIYNDNINKSISHIDILKDKDNKYIESVTIVKNNINNSDNTAYKQINKLNNNNKENLNDNNNNNNNNLSKLKTTNKVVKVKENDLIDIVEDLTFTKKKTSTDNKQKSVISASSFKLAFSNLNKPNMLKQRINFILNNVNPQDLPTVFKNDLDKDLLLEILKCLNAILPDKQELVVKYLNYLSLTNRFNLLIKFIKNKKELFDNMFSKFDDNYESSLITIKDRYYK